MILTKALANVVKLSTLYHTGFSFIIADNIEQPNWKTIRKYRLTQGEFVKRYLDELTLLGVSFGTETRMGAIDIDSTSKYHPAQNPAAFKKLQQTLEAIGIVRLEIIQSSYSGGIHLIIFFPYSISTFRLAALLQVTLINAGFEISKGQLENFPNPKAYGSRENPTYYNALRLPLQPNAGGLLLDAEGNILLTADNLTDESRLAALTRNAEASMAAQDMELLERKLSGAVKKYTSNIAKYQHNNNKKLYSEIAREWKESLELTMMIGWQRKGQTNILLPIYIAYGVVFKGLKGTELAKWMHTEITSTSGYSEYCQHQHEIDKIIQDWVKNTERQEYYVEYCGFPDRSGQSVISIIKHLQVKANANQNERNESVAKRTVEKITTVVAEIRELPSRIIDRIALIQSKCHELFGDKLSKNTLYKKEYKQLWQQKQVTQPTQVIQSTQPEIENSSQTSFSYTPPQKYDPTLDPQSQSQQHFSYTPPIYETFRGNLSTPNNATSTSEVIEDSIVLVDFELNQLQTYLEESFQLASLVEPEVSDLTFSATNSSEQSALIELNSSNQFEIITEIDSGLESQSEISPEILDLIQSKCETVDSLSLTQSPSSIDLETQSVCEYSLEPDLDPSSDASIENLEPVGNHLKSEVELIQSELVESPLEPEEVSLIEPGTKLRRNLQQLGRNTYPALHNCEVVSSNGLDWLVREADGSLYNVSPHALESGQWEIESNSVDSPQPIASSPVIRSVADIARDLRMNIAAISDDLLSECLNHSLRAEIQSLIELADAVVAAQSRVEIHRLVGYLSQSQKLELWRVMSDLEQAAIKAMMQKSIDPGLIDRRFADSVMKQDNLTEHLSLPSRVTNEIPAAATTPESELIAGTTVLTITGLVGIIRHVFKHLGKRFVVYHEHLDRTMLYTDGELLMGD
jgi:hypothetical protein